MASVLKCELYREAQRFLGEEWQRTKKKINCKEWKSVWVHLNEVSNIVNTFLVNTFGELVKVSHLYSYLRNCIHCECIWNALSPFAFRVIPGRVNCRLLGFRERRPLMRVLVSSPGGIWLQERLDLASIWAAGSKRIWRIERISKAESRDSRAPNFDCRNPSDSPSKIARQSLPLKGWTGIGSMMHLTVSDASEISKIPHTDGGHWHFSFFSFMLSTLASAQRGRGKMVIRRSACRKETSWTMHWTFVPLVLLILH